MTKAEAAEAAEAEEADVVEAKAQQFVRAILHQSGSVAANSPKDEAHDDPEPVHACQWVPSQHCSAFVRFGNGVFQ